MYEVYEWKFMSLSFVVTQFSLGKRLIIVTGLYM